MTARKPLRFAIAFLLAVATKPSGAAAEPPDFGPNVLLFDPAMTNIQSRMDTVFSQQERAQFGPHRYAYLFKPGKYNLDVTVRDRP